MIVLSRSDGKFQLAVEQCGVKLSIRFQKHRRVVDIRPHCVQRHLDPGDTFGIGAPRGQGRGRSSITRRSSIRSSKNSFRMVRRVPASTSRSRKFHEARGWTEVPVRRRKATSPLAASTLRASRTA